MRDAMLRYASRLASISCAARYVGIEPGVRHERRKPRSSERLMDGLPATAAASRTTPHHSGVDAWNAVAGKPRICQAVFLHTGWRTAGTWLWSRFRARPDVMGFYEPLHERLDDLALHEIPELRADTWDS